MDYWFFNFGGYSAVCLFTHEIFKELLPMSLAKKILSAVLSVSVGMVSLGSAMSSAAAEVENGYVYDSTISEKSKDLDNEKKQPFNVFDIYNAYYEIVSQTPAVTTTAAKTTITTKATKKTTTTAKPTTTRTTTTTKKTTTTTTTTKAATTTSTTTTTKAATTTTATAATSAVTLLSTTIQPVVTSLPAERFPNGGYINGIDVSQWQYIIDWQKVKNSGQVDFAIIKAGWGKHADQVDPFFKTNMEQAQAVGLDTGIYWFSYAMSVEEAKEEALACLEVIKGYSFNYPIYYDFEYYEALNTLSYATLSAMIETFCSTLQEHGYYTGVYGSGSDFEYRIYRHVLDKYPVWVAEYDTPTLTWYTGNHGMWQYSPKGRIDGISTDVDLNYCYVDYPSIVGVNPKDGRLPVVTTTAATTAAVNTTTTAYNTTTEFVTTTAAERVYNGKIVELDTAAAYDWNTFDKSTYDFAMIQADSSEIGLIGENIDKAHSFGINCGVVFECNTVTSEKIKEDIAALDAQFSGRRFDYPLYFGLTGSNSGFAGYGFDKNNAAYIADEFCSYFESKRYFVGIMAEDKVLGYRFNSDLLSRYDIWQIKYNNDPSLYTGKCGIISRIDPVSGELRITTTRNYPDIMTYNGLNGYTLYEENLGLY